MRLAPPCRYASGARAGTSLDRVHGDDDIYAFPCTVFTTLLARLDSPNDELAQASAGLLAELLAVNSDVAIDRMILSALAPHAAALEEQVWRGPGWEQLGIGEGEGMGVDLGPGVGCDSPVTGTEEDGGSSDASPPRASTDGPGV